MKTLPLRSSHILTLPLCLLALAVPATGCGDDGGGGGGGTEDGTGTGGATDGVDGTADGTATEGDDTGGEANVLPPPGGMHRLTPNQYVSSIEVILGADIAAAANPPPLPELGTFDSETVNVEPLTPIDIELYESSALAMGTAVMNEPASLNALVPCVADGQDPSCYETVAAELGRLAWRRPLTSEEVADIVEIANAAYEWGGNDFLTGIKYLVGTVFQSPHFLYVVEVGEEGEGDYRELTDYEMASRLSFFLLGHTPDAATLDTAESGQLSENGQIRAVAEDMLSRPAARTRLAEFYDELYKLRELENKGKDAELFPTFTPELATAMRQETLLLIQNVVFEEESNFLGIFDANYTFVNDDLAQLYGMEPPEFPWQLVSFPEGQQRAGFLTHPAFLSVFSHPDINSPTRRGLFVQETLLCTDILPPPPDVEVMPPAPMDGQTLREWLENEHNQDDSCAACHALMDPIGFAFERYSAIGAFRQLDNGLPIDSSGEVGGVGSFGGAADLAGLIRNDPRVPNCVVRNLYRSTLGHDPGLDQAAGIATLDESFSETDYNYKALMVELTVNPLFRLVDAPK